MRVNDWRGAQGAWSLFNPKNMRSHISFLIFLASLGLGLSALANDQLLQLPLAALPALEVSLVRLAPQEFVSDYLPLVQTDIGRRLTLKAPWRF